MKTSIMAAAVEPHFRSQARSKPKKTPTRCDRCLCTRNRMDRRRLETRHMAAHIPRKGRGESHRCPERATRTIASRYPSATSTLAVSNPK